METTWKFITRAPARKHSRYRSTESSAVWELRMPPSTSASRLQSGATLLMTSATRWCSVDRMTVRRWATPLKCSPSMTTSVTTNSGATGGWTGETGVCRTEHSEEKLLPPPLGTVPRLGFTFHPGIRGRTSRLKSIWWTVHRYSRTQVLSCAWKTPVSGVQPPGGWNTNREPPTVPWGPTRTTKMETGFTGEPCPPISTRTFGSTSNTKSWVTGFFTGQTERKSKRTFKSAGSGWSPLVLLEWGVTRAATAKLSMTTSKSHYSFPAPQPSHSAKHIRSGLLVRTWEYLAKRTPQPTPVSRSTTLVSRMGNRVSRTDASG